MTRARLIRAGIYTASTLAFLTAVIGALHLRAARPLLAKLGVKCPIEATGADVERARLKSARSARGTETATSRPALGFALDTMTLADVHAWADKNHVECDESRQSTLLKCTNVPGSAVGNTGSTISELDFGFTPKDARLVNLSAWHNGMSSAAAAAEMNAVVASLEKQLGAPLEQKGDRSASYLAAAPMRTAVVQYRFSDYIADVSATNIPGSGLIMREHYMSARD